jgi:hypothetical protein
LYRCCVLPCSGTAIKAVISPLETADWWTFSVAADRTVPYVMWVTDCRPVVDWHNMPIFWCFKLSSLDKIIPNVMCDVGPKLGHEPLRKTCCILAALDGTATADSHTPGGLHVYAARNRYPSELKRGNWLACGVVVGMPGHRRPKIRQRHEAIPKMQPFRRHGPTC